MADKAHMEDKLPIGIQGFEGLRRDQYLYVDKTMFIYRLAHTGIAHTGKEYFLSRPRRFGKSLLLSAMRAYWEGKKDLFDGLVISEYEEKSKVPWQPYPVFYFDFNGQNYQVEGALETALDIHLRRWEKEWDLDGKGKDILTFAADNRKLYKIGVNFDSKKTRPGRLASGRIKQCSIRPLLKKRPARSDD